MTPHRALSLPLRFAKIPEDEALLSEEERSSSESESDHSEEEREQKLLVLQNQVREDGVWLLWVLCGAVL